VFIILVIPYSLLSQNLVVNPGFEQFYDCPGSYNYSLSEKIAPGWQSPSMGTPDLFNACSKGDASVPTNWAGNSKAYNGSGYAGIYVFIAGKQTPYREYVQTQLQSPMEAGATYLIEFYYKLSSNSKYSIDRIGLLISDSSNRFNSDGVYPENATYEKISKKAYDSNVTGIWARFGYSYLAQGGEQFITIGNFSDDSKTRSHYISTSKAKEPMLDRGAYYFIDEVKVVMIRPSKAPTLTGYPEVKTNENYVLKNIQFKYNEYTLLDSSFPELKKVVDIMRFNKNWKVTVTGHTDDIGSEEFNLELSLNRATAVGDYLVSNGISPARIKIQGFGKQTPLVKGTDENSRALNRRVELRFTN
jgi:outer membrane protein OmpA-like peptidoglycan-associated protein